MYVICNAQRDAFFSLCVGTAHRKFEEHWSSRIDCLALFGILQNESINTLQSVRCRYVVQINTDKRKNVYYCFLISDWGHSKSTCEVYTTTVSLLLSRYLLVIRRCLFVIIKLSPCYLWLISHRGVVSCVQY